MCISYDSNWMKFEARQNGWRVGEPEQQQGRAWRGLQRRTWTVGRGCGCRGARTCQNSLQEHLGAYVPLMQIIPQLKCYKEKPPQTSISKSRKLKAFQPSSAHYVATTAQGSGQPQSRGCGREWGQSHSSGPWLLAPGSAVTQAAASTADLIFREKPEADLGLKYTNF